MAKDSLTARTDAKLRYARLHLKELRECEQAGRGHDFERAHQDAFFAQLFGAYAALFQELNEDLACGLTPEAVSLGNMRDAMKKTGAVSPKLTTLYQLERDPEIWLAQAKAMRDYLTHVAAVPSIFHVGGSEHTALRHPKTGTEIPGEYFDILERWLDAMERLVGEMRK